MQVKHHTPANLSSSGLTLGEVIMAIALASIALLTLTLFTSVIHRINREGKQQALASTFARQGLERFRSDPDFQRQVVSNLPYTYTEQEQLPTAQAGNHTPTTFTVTIYASPLSGTQGRYYTTKVIVSWEDGKKKRQVQLDTYTPKIFF